MKIAGLQRCSMVDYPGKVAAVVFTPGCNMNCHYCHNRALLEPNGGEEHDAEEVLGFLTRRRRMLDGVVVTGGEPTLQHGLTAFVREVRALGLAVKLDTNGTRPAVVARLLDEGLLDFVAMDVKAPFSRYGEICGVDVRPEDLQETVNLVLKSGVEHEFRTTVTPLLSPKDVLQLAGIVEGGSRLVLQQYRPPRGGDRVLAQRHIPHAHSPAVLKDVAQQISRRALPCTTRGL